jgi:hypothetical protein
MIRMEDGARSGNRRSPNGQKRTYVLSVKLSVAERDAARAAAKRAGMLLSAWAGDLIADAAQHRALPVGWLRGEIIRELIRLRGALAIIRDQLAEALNSGDMPGTDLEPVLGGLREVIELVEWAAEKVRRGM